MKKINDLRKNLKAQLPNNGLNKVFAELKQVLYDTSQIYETVLILEGRIKQNDQKEHLGTISQEEHTVEYNRVFSALINTIDDIQESDLKKAGSLLFSIRSPRLKVDMFQCDQHKARQRFEEKFLKAQETEIQHFIILAERHQQPRRFIEHLIFELEDRSLKLDYDQIGEENIRIIPIDRGSSLESSKAFFKQDFGRRFQLNNLEHLSDVQSSTVFTKNNHYTIAAFECSEWHAHTESFLLWLINSFCQSPPLLPTQFLFFYILDKDMLKQSIFNLFNPRKITRGQIKKALNKLDNHPACTLIPELQPVPAKDLINWLHNFISNEDKIDELMERVFGVLPGEKDKKVLNMSFIENQLMSVV